MSIFAFICPYQLLTLNKKVTFHQLFSRPGPYDPYGYAAWETDEVIAEEVYRNLAVAVICVFFTILIFICNLRAATIIICCVILTLINVGGFMHFWGLTIDTVSCNNLIIAIGLCVDYSAHMTHRFLVEQGNKDQRIVATMQNIGPAVFNGGFSTFLAFILLAGSKSHVFISFFKIFFFGCYFWAFPWIDIPSSSPQSHRPCRAGANCC